MPEERTGKPVTVWVKRDHLLEGERTCPVLAALWPEEAAPELRFWNPLRKIAASKIRIEYFDEVDDAGPLVVTPHSMVLYGKRDRLAEVTDFNGAVLRSGRNVVTFALIWEYRPTPGEIVYASATFADRPDTRPSPHWLYDWSHLVGPVERPEKPRVAFVGNVEFPNRLNRLVRHVPVPFPVKVRAARTPRFRSRKTVAEFMAVRQVIARWVRTGVITRLRGSDLIDLDYIGREKAFFCMTEDEKKRAREEYLQNLREAPYRLVMRGDANAVFSLYETMAVGRIPIIVQTGMRLPPIPGMKWSDFALIHDFKDLDTLDRAIRDFHYGLGEEQFRERCQLARSAFERLSPKNFFEDTLFPALRELSATAQT